MQYTGTGAAPLVTWSFSLTPYAGASLPASNAGLDVTASDASACDANAGTNGAGALNGVTASGSVVSSTTSALTACKCP